jgi:hypothetical protein
MQGLYEYDLKPAAAYSGMISDTNFRPNIIYRTLAGGRTYQTVTVQVNTVNSGNTFIVTAGLILLNGSPFTATVTVTATAALNTPDLIERELARRLQSIPEFDQVAVADASSGNLVVRAKRFGVNPISTFTINSTPVGLMVLAVPLTPAVNVLEIPFGFVVTETAADTPTECRLFTSASQTILGIALASATVEQDYPPSNLPISASTPPDRYRAGDIVPILDFRQKGQRVWVWCRGNPVKGEEAWISGSGQVSAPTAAPLVGYLGGARFTGRVSGSIAEIEF